MPNERTRTDLVLQEVSAELEEHHGVATFPMKDLKDLARVKRLGGDIRRQIEFALDGANIGFFPSPLPSYETQYVRLYRKDQSVGKLIDAIVAIGVEDSDARTNYDVLQHHDKVIRDFVTGNTTIERDAIQKIRRILEALK